jgi:hypothetical protein
MPREFENPRNDVGSSTGGLSFYLFIGYIRDLLCDVTDENCRQICAFTVYKEKKCLLNFQYYSECEMGRACSTIGGRRGMHI